MPRLVWKNYEPILKQHMLARGFINYSWVVANVKGMESISRKMFHEVMKRMTKQHAWEAFDSKNPNPQFIEATMCSCRLDSNQQETAYHFHDIDLDAKIELARSVGGGI